MDLTEPSPGVDGLDPGLAVPSPCADCFTLAELTLPLLSVGVDGLPLEEELDGRAFPPSLDVEDLPLAAEFLSGPSPGRNCLKLETDLPDGLDGLLDGRKGGPGFEAGTTAVFALPPAVAAPTIPDMLCLRGLELPLVLVALGLGSTTLPLDNLEAFTGGM